MTASPELTPVDGTLVSADNGPIKIYGQAKMVVMLGPVSVLHTVIVADIANEGLIGSQFLREHGVILDFERHAVYCNRSTLETICSVGLTLKETTIIPAASRLVVEAETSGPLPEGVWMVEPSTKTPGRRPIMVARTITLGSGSALPTELLNPFDEDILLYKGTTLGEASSVSVVQCDDRRYPDTQALPEELEKLIKDSTLELEEGDRDAVRKLIENSRAVFASKQSPFGHTTIIQHGIETGHQTPIKQALRRPPFHIRAEAEAEVEKMLKSGVIEPSRSPWSSPIVLVRKKDSTLRFCIDYRKLNAVTCKDSYPLPRIDDSLDALGQAPIFTTLDLASGYWQIGLEDDAKEKSDFCTTSGLYQFRVMPFGLTNAPATFQRLMETVLAVLEWKTCLVYIDDIIIYSRSVSEHVDALEEIFKLLMNAGLKLKPIKCNLFRHQVRYLGYIVGRDGISTDPEKIAAIVDWRRPQGIGDVRSFIGLCSYYRRFVKDFATMSKPLAKLTEKNAAFVWGSEQQKSWDALKRCLTSAPVLVFPDRGRTFTLHTDASDVGIGAVLSQGHGDQERVVACGSRMLTKQERKYHKERIAGCSTLREVFSSLFGGKRVSTTH
jgi:hypothetical protein